MSWTPRLSLDLNTASNNAFNKVLEDFEAWRQTQPQRALDLSNGWKFITPEIAEGMLLRNPVGANRRPTLQTVKYYARQMLAGVWKKTGQAILFDTDGKLLDASHRLWAGYLSGASFPTFVIGDVPPDPTLFAFIDNNKVRSIPDALSTSGLNGLAKSLAPVVSMAMHFDHGLYTASAKKGLGKITPMEAIEYVQRNMNLRSGVRLMAGEYNAAREIIEHSDVAAFVASQIIKLHGEATLDGFMNELGSNEPGSEGSPVAALRKTLAEDAKSAKPMMKHQVLGYIIKAFNAWVTGEHVKKLVLKVEEPFPQFVQPQPFQQAAE